ncbi:MAG: DUF4082 domain-containing protein [Rubrivivax sp.]
MGGVLTAVAAAVLAGCGGGGGGSTASQAVQAAGLEEAQVAEQPNAVALATTDSTGWKWVANEGRVAWLPASTTVRFGSAPTTNGPLVAPQSVTGAGNGLYRYGSSLAFPSATWRAANYWVGVVFGP